MFGRSALGRLLLKCKIVSKGIPYNGTGVNPEWAEELWQKKAIGLWSVKEWVFVDEAVIEDLADRTAQKQQQTWESDNTVRYSSH